MKRTNDKFQKTKQCVKLKWKCRLSEPSGSPVERRQGGRSRARRGWRAEEESQRARGTSKTPWRLRSKRQREKERTIDLREVFWIRIVMFVESREWYNKGWRTRWSFFSGYSRVRLLLPSPHWCRHVTASARSEGRIGILSFLGLLIGGKIRKLLIINSSMLLQARSVGMVNTTFMFLLPRRENIQHIFFIYILLNKNK